MAEEVEGAPPVASQELVFMGERCEDHLQLKDYGINMPWIKQVAIALVHTHVWECVYACVLTPLQQSIKNHRSARLSWHCTHVHALIYAQKHLLVESTTRVSFLLGSACACV